MLDSHCHVDLIDDPVGTSRRLEKELSNCVAVTMIPEHYQHACQHLEGFAHVIPALGSHPLRCIEAESQLGRFRTLAKTARFIGEIGVDGSSEGKPTLERQKRLFREVLRSIQPDSFVTVHSRNAWQETLEIVSEVGLGPLCFHYFTGGASAAERVIGAGHFISVNHKMTQSTGRHREFVRALPRDRVLVESDAPFTGGMDPVSQIRKVYNFLSECWGFSLEKAEVQVENNFAACRTGAAVSGTLNLF